MTTTRRKFLQTSSAILGLGVVGAILPASRTGTNPIAGGEPPADDALDEVLVRFHAKAPEYGGLANHGPMVAEALETLGRSAAIGAFAAAYERRLPDAPASGTPLRDDEWRAALGRPRDFPRWLSFFRNALADGDWRQVVRLWAPRLAPGFAGAATHGILRTGHAVRALERRTTPARLEELAQGLAYWAAVHQVFYPGVPKAGSLLPSQAIAKVPFLPDERRIGSGPTAGRLAPLRDFAPFGSAVDLADWKRDPSLFLSDLSRAFASVYLANAAVSSFASIILVHTVTGPSSVRMLLPYLDEGGRQALLAYAWLTAAGFFSVVADHRPGAPEPSGHHAPGDHLEPASLIEGAIENGSVHAIKFTEACLREWKIAPDPLLLQSAADGVGRLRA